MQKSPLTKYWFCIFILCIAAFGLFRALDFSNSNDHVELYFLDVGQGDSELIALPRDVQILIDGGPPNGKLLDALSRVLSPGDRYIDAIVITHPQLDHFGGFIDLLDRYEVGMVIGSGRAGEIAAYKEFEAKRNAYKIPYVSVEKDDAITYGGARFDVLSPSPNLLKSKELNDTSVVLKFTYKGLGALYTGDVGFLVEDILVKNGGIDVDILKVGHHGSRFSSANSFLASVSPKIAVIEVGKNSYGHPTPAALGRLKDVGAQIFRTDQDGIIKIVINGENIEVYTKK